MDIYPDQTEKITAWDCWYFLCLHEYWILFVLLSVLICMAGHVYIYLCVVYFCLCVYWEHMLSLVRLNVGRWSSWAHLCWAGKSSHPYKTTGQFSMERAAVVLWPNSLLKVRSAMGSDQLTQGFLAWKLHNVSGQLVPNLDYPCGEEVFTYSKSELCSFFFFLCCSFSSQQLAWDCVLGLCWKVLINQGCPAGAEQCSHRVKDFSASHTAWPVRRLGGTRRWKSHSWQRLPADPRDILHNTTSFSAIKALWKKKKGAFGHFAYAVFPSRLYPFMKPFSRDS